MKKLKTHDKYEDDWLTKKEAPYYYKECIWVFRFIGIFSLLNAVLLAAYWRIRVAEAAVPCLELGVIWLIMCWCRSVSHRKSKRNAAELLLIGILTVGYTGYAAHEMRCYWLLAPAGGRNRNLHLDVRPRGLEEKEPTARKGEIETTRTVFALCGRCPFFAFSQALRKAHKKQAASPL